MQASVKVMRSYDYCHFEVALTDDCATLDDVDALRKQAAVLVDEAVRQYKIAKRQEGKREGNEYQVRMFLERLERIKAKPRSELTPDEAATLRGAADREFMNEYDDDAYYYSDPEREMHFSMLRRFRDLYVDCTGGSSPD